MTRNLAMGIAFGMVLVSFWLRRQFKIGFIGLLVLAIIFMVVVQLMRAAGCFKG